MAEAQTISGRRVYIRLGDGNSPEEFDHPCSINGERSISFEVATGETVVPDCDNPEAPGWIKRIKQSKSCTIAGAGTLHTPDIEEFMAWFGQEASRNCQVALVDADNGVLGQWSGKFHLTEFSLTGPEDQVANVSLTAISDGAVAFVPQAT